MPLHQRLDAMRRHELWGELCQLSVHLYDIADEIHELTLKWWALDPDLVDVHHDRCRITGDEPDPTSVDDDSSDLDF